MQIYSESILAFLSKVRREARKIMRDEMHLEVRTKRVLYKGYLFPINFVMFESPSKWGWFDSHAWQIGLNKSLIYQAKQKVWKDILRHELAHFFQFMSTGTLSGHDQNFREICESFGWGDSVFKAKSHLETENLKIEGDLKTEALLSKVQKLLSLADSSNSHESELATIKANQLIVKHNLQNIQNQSEEACLLRVCEAARNNSKLQAIYDILTTFMVQPVFNHGKKGIYLEVIGSKTNVKIADYVASFLEDELEQLWKKTRITNSDLKGAKARNSFFRGVAKGYLEKHKAITLETVSGKDLILLNRQLQTQVNMVYGRLGTGRSSQSSTDTRSENLGKKAGSLLNIRRGLNSSESKTHLLGQ
ncbi:MAG: DUF2786 domain-containing protein [Deltaproteobacteria bacterium]|nr:MAG: DUF2786 domain-containing protein [Deltaproteobacteria bacterium]